MNKEFIPYDQALALKELGFDEPCFGYYNYNGTHFFDYKPKTDDKKSSFVIGEKLDDHPNV